MYPGLIADTAILGFLENLGYTAMVVLGVGFLIFFHELGHFLAAKWAGVRVEVFSLGFGSRLFGWKRGDTDYRLSLVPIGGYVRMYGEAPGEGDPSDPDSLTNKSVGWRFLIFSGGVVMNLLFALAAFPIVFKSGVPFVAPVVGDVSPGSVAWEAGLEPGDRVVSADGKPLYSFDQLTVEAALAGERGIDLHMQRADSSFNVRVHPRFDASIGVKRLGILPPYEEALYVHLDDGDGPARVAGLRDGDRVVDYLGRPYTWKEDARLAREQQLDPAAWNDPGRKLDLTVDRDGHAIRFQLTPEVREGSKRLGIMMLTAKVIGLRDLGDVALRRDLETLGLQIGDIITGVRDAARALPLIDGLQLRDLLASATPGCALEVLRAGPAATDVSGAPQVACPVPPGFLGPQGAERLHGALALGGDDLTGRVYAQPGLAAASAGLATGDRILALDGIEVRTWGDIASRVREATGAMRVRWQPVDGTAVREAEIAPRPDRNLDYGFSISARPLKETFRAGGLARSLEAGAVCSIDTLRQLYVTLKRILGGTVSAENLGGIITISRVTYETARSGWQRYLYFLAILSLNLAFINVLPIPVLDGGQLLFLLIEKIKGSPVSARVMTYAQILGFVVVIGLLIFVTYNDILRLIR